MTNRRLSLLLTSLLVSGVGLGGWSTPRPGLAQDIQVTADVTVYAGDVEDVSVFYEPLAPYGTWMALPEYGRVWRPHGVPGAWRPYTEGRWVYTEHGWTWVSEWEWGWAPFHYGRWTFVGAHGWVWVPGTVWGPAWVVWRHTPGWVGWAPLPPQAVFRPGIGLSVENIDVHITPSWFCFVEERRILAPRVVRYIAPPARNPSLIHITQNVTHYTVIQNRVVNHSIPVQRIERVTARPVPRMHIVEAHAPEATRSARVREREREVVMFRPDAGRQGRTTLPEAQTPRDTPPVQRAPGTTTPQPPQDAHRRLQEQQIRERATIEERQRQARERATIEERQHRAPQPQSQSVSPEELRRRDEAQRRALEDKARRDHQTREQQSVQPQPGSVQPPRPQGPSSEALQRQREAERRALEDKVRRDRQTREQPPIQQQLQPRQTPERQPVVQPQPQPQLQPPAQPQLQPQVQPQLQQQEYRRGGLQQQHYQPPPLPQGVSPEASQQQRVVPRHPVEEGKEQRKKQQLPPSQQQPPPQ